MFTRFTPLVSALSAIALISAAEWRPLRAQSAAPTATLVPAPAVVLGDADSNSPAVWDLVNGRQRFFAFTSINGSATRHFGTDLSSLFALGPVDYPEAAPPHGVWFEAVIPDVDGTWYAYYHNELPAEICGETERVIPRIGAARSRDFGATWQDLGVVLEAPYGWHDCTSTNTYFVGGVGDFSVQLDRESRYLYFFISQYASREETQGVAVARMPWADRDEPGGKMSVWWRGSLWVPSRRLRMPVDGREYVYPAGVPIYRATDEWHHEGVDAFWGPSVHWNTYLEQYVMLLNRARDTEWAQEGVYIAFSPTLSDPTKWTVPRRLIAGGSWYPQVIGLEAGIGSDKVAGQRARFFLGGRSHYFIQFTR